MKSLLGRREGQKLEFKRWDSLGKDPAGVAREVVGMLNAEGGEVWIGVREEGGIAVGVEPLAAEEVARRVRSLHDHLIDTVEPSPRQEVEVDSEPVEGVELIRIRAVPSSSRKPYAYVRQFGRDYAVRVGDRLRRLTRDEIATEFCRGERVERERGEAKRRALERARKELEEIPPAARNQGLFWLRLSPIEDRHLVLTRVRDAELLTDSARTGVEGLLGSFTNAYRFGKRLPVLRAGRLIVGKEGAYWLEVDRAGGLLFKAPLVSFAANPIREGERLLYALSLLDYPVSLLRLLRKMLAEDDLWEPAGRVPGEYVVHMALFGLGGWTLLPGTPSPPFQVGWEQAFRSPPLQVAHFSQEDFVLDRPLSFTAEEIEAAPDRCAFRLVARLYEAFDLSEDDMPRQFDRATDRYDPKGG